MPEWSSYLILIAAGAAGGLLTWWLLFTGYPALELEPDEMLIKEQFAQIMVDRKFSRFGNGRLFLTSKRLVWMRARLPILGPAKQQAIDLTEISLVDVGQPMQWMGPHTLSVRAGEHEYAFAFDPIFSEGRDEWQRLIKPLLEERDVARV